jgi:hypothetical protein
MKDKNKKFFVVVGCGAPGMIAARRLAEKAFYDINLRVDHRDSYRASLINEFITNANELNKSKYLKALKDVFVISCGGLDAEQIADVFFKTYKTQCTTRYLPVIPIVHEGLCFWYNAMILKYKTDFERRFINYLITNYERGYKK